MNLQDFTGYLHDPYQPVHQKKEDLHDLSLRFPYCSSIQVLYSLLLFSENDLEFNTQLKKTAAYLPGRKRLKELLDGFNTPVEEPRSAADDTLEPEAMIPDPVSEIRHPGPTVTRNDLMDRVKKRLEEIKREKEGAELPA